MNVKHRQFIGVDVGGTQIKMAAFAPDGRIINRWKRKTIDRPTRDVPHFAKTVRRMLRSSKSGAKRIGIAAPGVAARNGRFIAFQPGKMHGIEGFDWTTFLQRKECVPVLNDAQAALLGEVWRGAAVGCRNVVMLTLGTGVGGAVLCDGRLLRGAIGRAGHLGHTSVEPGGDRSIFGMPGALETAIGDCTVSQRSGGRFSSTFQLIVAQLDGDVAAQRVWLKSVQTLARAVASFINCFDPEIVIIGGGIAQAGRTLFGPLTEFLDEIEWRPNGHRVHVKPAALGEWAGTYGAAWNAMRTRI
jgi:glucokinase